MAQEPSQEARLLTAKILQLEAHLEATRVELCRVQQRVRHLEADLSSGAAILHSIRSQVAALSSDFHWLRLLVLTLFRAIASSVSLLHDQFRIYL